tara:strand:- start:179530 stop:179985 length:456 start_codon:yes stop_codon:yes gene_type:complete
MSHMYKIRRKKDGAYSSQGMYGWDLNGTAWFDESSVKRHITTCIGYKYNYYNRNKNTDEEKKYKGESLDQIELIKAKIIATDAKTLQQIVDERKAADELKALAKAQNASKRETRRIEKEKKDREKEIRRRERLAKKGLPVSDPLPPERVYL